MIDMKAFKVCSQASEKNGGDLRECFEIMRNTIQTKITKCKEKSEELESAKTVVTVQEVLKIF